MNPLEWKREHQLGLLICTGIGFALGFAFGLHAVDKYGYQYSWANSDLTANILYWCAVVILGILGAIVGAAIVYAVQLMRS